MKINSFLSLIIFSGLILLFGIILGIVSLLTSRFAFIYLFQFMVIIIFVFGGLGESKKGY